MVIAEKQLKDTWSEVYLADLTYYVDPDDDWLDDVREFSVYDDDQVIGEWDDLVAIFHQVLPNGDTGPGFSVTVEQYELLAEIDERQHDELFDLEVIFELCQLWWRSKDFQSKFPNAQPFLFDDSIFYSDIDDCSQSTEYREFHFFYAVTPDFAKLLEAEDEIVESDPAGNIVWCRQGFGVAPHQEPAFREAAQKYIS